MRFLLLLAAVAAPVSLAPAFALNSVDRSTFSPLSSVEAAHTVSDAAAQEKMIVHRKKPGGVETQGHVEVCPPCDP